MRAWILVGSLAAAIGAAACGTQAASPFLRCEPGQHAVVSQSLENGRPVTSVACAFDASAAAPANEPAAVARPAVLRTEAPGPARSTAVVAEHKPARSWQKRAMVIGGSSGAGAGIGALIGGKKGALIGAAIGAGGGTVYEMRKK